MAAQKQLEQLRRLHQENRSEQTASLAAECHGRFPTTSPTPLPQHLGWHSGRVTDLLRQTINRRQTAPEQPAPLSKNQIPSPASAAPAQVDATAAPESVKLYPDIALGMLRQNQSAAGRLWLLLKQLDGRGQGWLDLASARQVLTTPGADLKLCGRRQFRKLLAQGEGLFWQRNNGRIWLRSTAKVAAGLHIPRLNGRPVALPVAILLGKIGRFRAHLYASFHSSRANNQPGSPIARQTLQKLSGVSRRSQHTYERQAGCRRRPNLAVSPATGQKEHQNRAWQHGRAVFNYTDYRGRLGRPRKNYLAWQLPNSYTGPHRHRPKGRQKRINRELADLFMKGMTGNSEETITRRFCDNGLAAARCYQNASQDLYWPSTAPQNKASRLWHLLPGQETK